MRTTSTSGWPRCENCRQTYPPPERRSGCCFDCERWVPVVARFAAAKATVATDATPQPEPTLTNPHQSPPED